MPYLAESRPGKGEKIAQAALCWLMACTGAVPAEISTQQYLTQQTLPVTGVGGRQEAQGRSDAFAESHIQHMAHGGSEPRDGQPAQQVGQVLPHPFPAMRHVPQQTGQIRHLAQPYAAGYDVLAQMDQLERHVNRGGQAADGAGVIRHCGEVCHGSPPLFAEKALKTEMVQWAVEHGGVEMKLHLNIREQGDVDMVKLWMGNRRAHSGALPIGQAHQVAPAPLHPDVYVAGHTQQRIRIVERVGLPLQDAGAVAKRPEVGCGLRTAPVEQAVPVSDALHQPIPPQQHPTWRTKAGRQAADAVEGHARHGLAHGLPVDSVPVRVALKEAGFRGLETKAGGKQRQQPAVSVRYHFPVFVRGRP